MKTISEILEAGDAEYQAYFQKKLEKYGVKSPDELKDEDKKKFFDEVDRDWKGKTESKGVNADGTPLSEISSEDNPAFIFQTTNTSLLLMIIKKRLDPVMAAKRELANRGLDDKGKWIGFDASAKLHGVK